MGTVNSICKKQQKKVSHSGLVDESKQSPTFLLRRNSNLNFRCFLLQSNWENREQQKYFWNIIIVLQEKCQLGVRKLNRKQEH